MGKNRKQEIIIEPSKEKIDFTALVETILDFDKNYSNKEDNKNAQ